VSGLPAAEQPTEVTVTATRYAVSALPKGFEEAWRWDLTVQQQRDGHWIVGDGSRLLDIDGNWGSPGAAWQRRFQHTEDWALRIARAEAPNVSVNGITVADAIARSKEQPR
jgi:hypothetical protein